MRGKNNGLAALASNARRLLCDAELILKAGSHQTALSLAILAIEEVGKYFQIRWGAGDTRFGEIPARGPKAHRSKQWTVGSFYAAEASIAAVKEFVRKIGYSDDDETVQHFLTAIHLPDEKAQEALEKVVAFVAERMADDENSQLMRFAAKGLIDRIKQQGFYVDIGKDGKVVSSPAAITREAALEWLDHGRRAVARLPVESNA
jgi:AbiV family abortive infection protein